MYGNVPRNAVAKLRRVRFLILFVSFLALLFFSGLSNAGNKHAIAITVPKYVRISLSHTDLPVTIPDNALNGSSTVDVPTALNVTVRANCDINAKLEATDFLPETAGNKDDIPARYLQALISKIPTGSTFPSGWFQVASSSNRTYKIEGPIHETFVVKYRLSGNYSGLLPDTYRSTVTYTLAPI